jgi:hypothetical protein
MAKHLAKLLAKFSQIHDRLGSSHERRDQGRRLLHLILQELKEKPAARSEFVTYCKGELGNPDIVYSGHQASLQVIEYCMRELRWPEVLRMVKLRLDSESHRWRCQLFQRVLDRAYFDREPSIMIWDESPVPLQSHEPDAKRSR